MEPISCLNFLKLPAFGATHTDVIMQLYFHFLDSVYTWNS